MIEQYLVGGVSTAAALWGLFRYKTQSGQLQEARFSCADLYDKTIKAEQDKAKAEQELEFLRNTVVQMIQNQAAMMNRPVVATLSEQQSQNLTAAILTYAEAVKSPEKVN